MKKILVSCALIALAVAFIAIGINLNPVGAQGRPDDPGSQSAHRADGKVVAPDGVIFESNRLLLTQGEGAPRVTLTILRLKKSKASSEVIAVWLPADLAAAAESGRVGAAIQ